VLGASGGNSFFFLIVIAFIFIWFMFIRPQKKRQLEAARMHNTLSVGDEVVTAAGIYGEITRLDEDDVMVQIAPGVEVRVARKAIGAVTPRDVEPDEPAEPAEPEAAPDEPATGPDEPAAG
jgi:preprotein translocase subunit YajC